jgi:hypothetical protein
MRTTLQLDDDVLGAARSLARTEGKTIGQVVSELARRGLAPRPSRSGGRRSAVPAFDVSSEAPPLTPEMVREALEDAE